MAEDRLVLLFLFQFYPLCIHANCGATQDRAMFGSTDDASFFFFLLQFLFLLCGSRLLVGDNRGAIRNSRGTQAAHRLEGKGRSGNNAFFEVCRPLGDYLNGVATRRTRVNGITHYSLSRGSFLRSFWPFTRLLNASMCCLSRKIFQG